MAGFTHRSTGDMRSAFAGGDRAIMTACASAIGFGVINRGDGNPQARTMTGFA